MLSLWAPGTTVYGEALWLAQCWTVEVVSPASEGLTPWGQELWFTLWVPIILILWLALSNYLLQLNMNWKGSIHTTSTYAPTMCVIHCGLPFPFSILCWATHLLVQESLLYPKLHTGRNHIHVTHCCITGPGRGWHIRPSVNIYWANKSLRTNLLSAWTGLMENTLPNTKVSPVLICVN